jgi:hypothetical protein
MFAGWKLPLELRAVEGFLPKQLPMARSLMEVRNLKPYYIN